MVSTPAAQVTVDPARSRRVFAQADWVSLAIGTVLVGGAVLRLRAYVADRSLWLDEAFLALNLLRRSWGSMLGQLDFNQGAAPGFLVLEKGAASVGTSELVLRLLPLLLGLATLALILPVARRLCSPAAVPVACALTALAPSLIYYSTELKQYSGDVAAFLLLVWVGLKVHDGLAGRQAAVAAAAGALAILISQPAVFVAAGIGAVIVAAELLERRRPPDRASLTVIGVWGVSAGVVLAHALHASGGVLRSYAGSASFARVGGGGGGGSGARSSVMHSISLLPTSVAGDLGLPTTGLEIKLITYVLGAVALAGLAALLRRRPWPTLLLTTPIVVTVGASLFGHYPISSRTVLFIVPAAGCFMAEGIALCTRRASGRVGAVVGLALILLAFEAGLRSDARAVASPIQREEVRSIVSSVAALKKPGDRLYVTYAAQYALAYYGECGCAHKVPWPLIDAPGRSTQWAPAIEPGPTVEVQPYLGRNEQAYLAALGKLRPGRTWLLLSHVADDKEKAFLYERLLAALDLRGTRLATVREPGALAVLYDLR